MNDRFKFRARWKDTGKIIHDFMEDYAIGHLNDGALIVEQSTGLRDKNGVLIYEGDIVEYGSTNRVPFYAVCEFEGCSFGLRVYESVDFNWFDNELAETAHLYEVIASKYENPELLESS